MVSLRNVSVVKRAALLPAALAMGPPLPAAASGEEQFLFTVPPAISQADAVQGSKVVLQLSSGSGSPLLCSYSGSSGRLIFQHCEAIAHPPASDALERPPFRVRSGDQVLADTAAAAVTGCPKNKRCRAPDLSALRAAAPAACGATAASNLHFLGPLRCEGFAVALRWEATGRHLQGYGHAIEAPDASIGLFLRGSRLLVSHLRINGLGNGTGIFIYNSDRVFLVGNQFRQNQMGANFYTDSTAPQRFSALANDFSGNAAFGLRLNGDNGFRLQRSPWLRRNDFSRNGYYGLWAESAQLRLTGGSANRFDGSGNGVYFSGNRLVLRGLDWSGNGVPGNQVFADSAKSVFVLQSNLSSSAAPLPSQERIALHLYRVERAVVRQLSSRSSDVAVKLSTDAGVRSQLQVEGSTLTDQRVAGVMLQSWDGTPLGRIVIRGNDLSGNPPGRSVWIIPGTVPAPGSVISGNLQ